MKIEMKIVRPFRIVLSLLGLVIAGNLGAETNSATGLSSPATRDARNLPPAAKLPAQLRDVHRIVFLGDSITQAGDYVTDFECWLLSRGINIEVLNLGLASETASDLTEAENSGHLKACGFGRPFLSERLDRVLAATTPDLLFACYGMNDGDNLPPNEVGTKRFAEAVEHLRAAAIKSGVKRVALCTPPVYDGNGTHDESLARYSVWLLSKRKDGWEVVDLHGPMHKALDEARVKDSSFKFAGDGVHPGREGHWLMAREILTQFLGANLDGITSAEQLFKENGKEIRNLVHDRMTTRFDALMTKTGHKRPGVPGGPGATPGPSIREANAKAADIEKQISALKGGL